MEIVQIDMVDTVFFINKYMSFNVHRGMMIELTYAIGDGNSVQGIDKYSDFRTKLICKYF